MKFLDAGELVAEFDCEVMPLNLTLRRAIVLRGLHKDCPEGECLVYVEAAGWLEEHRDTRNGYPDCGPSLGPAA